MRAYVHASFIWWPIFLPQLVQIGPFRDHVSVYFRELQWRVATETMLGRVAAVGSNGECSSCSGCTEDDFMKRRLAYMLPSCSLQGLISLCSWRILHNSLYHLETVSESEQAKYFNWCWCSASWSSSWTTVQTTSSSTSAYWPWSGVWFNLKGKRESKITKNN